MSLEPGSYCIKSEFILIESNLELIAESYLI